MVHCPRCGKYMEHPRIDHAVGPLRIGVICDKDGCNRHFEVWIWEL